MKKAGILTLYGNTNYGNKLQNYAVQEVLKKMGLAPETFIYIGKEEHNLKFEKNFNSNKLQAFKEFNKNIKYYKDILYADKKPNVDFGSDLEYIILGSDQIWNYTFWDIFTPRVFADFASLQKKSCIFCKYRSIEITRKR